MIKLWNLQDLEQNWNAANGNVEPYITLRGHTGQVMCATARGDLLFTGGKEGSVKVWQIPSPSSISLYEDTQDGRNFKVSEF